MVTSPAEYYRHDPPREEVDPFRFGWRDVKRTLPDGSVEWDQIPLTLEDTLFPEVGDFIVHTRDHDDAAGYLKNVSKSQLSEDPSALVLGNTLVDWNIPGLKPLGPDVAVFLNVRRQENWSTFPVGEEGATPTLVIEVTSPQTIENDIVKKVDFYARAGIPYYIIVNYVEQRTPTRRTKKPWIASERTVIGYRLEGQHYQRIQPNIRGWIWADPVRLWIGIQDNHVQCYDEDENPVGDYVDIVKTLREERRQRVQAEQERNRERAGRVEAEKRAEQAEQERDRERSSRLEAEQSAGALAARIQELEEKLRQSGAG